LREDDKLTVLQWTIRKKRRKHRKNEKTNHGRGEISSGERGKKKRLETVGEKVLAPECPKTQRGRVLFLDESSLGDERLESPKEGKPV